MDNYIKNNFKQKNVHKFKENEKDVAHMTIEKSDGSTFTKPLKEKHSKRGWGKYYMKDLRELLYLLSEEPKYALKVWIELTKLFKRDGSIKTFKQKDIAEKLNISRSTVSKALKILINLEAIAKIDGEWRYNPFIITISGSSDSEIHDSQYLWEYEIGHYGKTYLDNNTNNTN